MSDPTLQKQLDAIAPHMRVVVVYIFSPTKGNAEVAIPESYFLDVFGDKLNRAERLEDIPVMHQGVHDVAKVIRLYVD